jgi:tetratricopeptide (TPR) repeat protein
VSSLKPEIDRLFGEADRLSQHRDLAGAVRCYLDILKLPEIERSEPLVAECAHWGLAELSIQSKQMEQAEEHLKQAIQLNPEEASYRQELGTLYNYQARFDLAIPALEESLRLRPDHPETIHLLGWVLFMSGERTRGRQLLQQAMELDDCDTAILNDLAVCLIEDGKLDQALALVERACTIDPRSQLLKSFRELILRRTKQKAPPRGGASE